MSTTKLTIGCICVACTFAGTSLQAQSSAVDTNYIRSISKQNVIEAYTGEYGTQFNFVSADNRKNSYKLVANTSGYIGTYLNYKWLSFKYSWAIPGTRLDRNTKFQYTSLSFRFSQTSTLFHPFYHSYNGLLIPEKKKKRRMVYTPLHDIHVYDAGTDFYYFTNGKKFSFNAANCFSERQVQSAGSFLLMVTPMWQRLQQEQPSQHQESQQHTTSTALHAFLSTNKQWCSLIGKIGYVYNLVFDKGRWSISPAVVIGGGALKEINTGDKYLRSVYDVQGWINAGYNGSNYYVHLNAQWGNLRTNLLIRDMHQTNTDLSVTAGLRFGNLHRRIMGIL